MFSVVLADQEPPKPTPFGRVWSDFGQIFSPALVGPLRSPAQKQAAVTSEGKRMNRPREMKEKTRVRFLANNNAVEHVITIVITVDGASPNRVRRANHQEDRAMAFISKIRSVGNSKGIILPQAVLEQLRGATGVEVDELEVKVEGKQVVLVPHNVRYATREEFEKAKKKVFRRHRELMKNLAKR